jgi:hypothetical protein
MKVTGSHDGALTSVAMRVAASILWRFTKAASGDRRVEISDARLKPDRANSATRYGILNRLERRYEERWKAT